MRIHRLLAFLSVAALAPLARGGAQTCQGTAQFREGKARVGVDYQRSGDLDYYRAGIAYGVQGSFFGGVSIDETQPSHGGASTTGFGGSLGYQFHWVDTPFQICPLVTLNYASGNGANTTSMGFGGSLGYRVEVQSGFDLVPAAGIRWMSNSTSSSGSSSSVGSISSSEVFMNFGMVFHRVWSVVPGVLFPSPASAKTRWTFGLAYNWGT
jgi:hypothetical protein